MNNLRRYEKDESQNLRRIIDEMNRVHAQMGGRDNRPERVALMRAMRLLGHAIEKARTQQEAA